MANELKELQKKYLDRQTEKVEIEKLKHVEKYDDNQKRSVERSRKNHQAAS
jgi:hypothetical protein